VPDFTDCFNLSPNRDKAEALPLFAKELAVTVILQPRSAHKKSRVG
jgi:hypothetical protein